MAATKSRSRTSTAVKRSNGVVTRAKDAGDTVASIAQRSTGPALAAGAAAAGLAGGLLIGSRVTSGRRLFGRRRSHAVVALASGARRAAAMAGKASNTADDIRAIREQLENANRRSPIEVVLDGLTHRPGTGKRERQLG
jgi:hypothetical protein